MNYLVVNDIQMSKSIINNYSLPRIVLKKIICMISGQLLAIKLEIYCNKILRMKSNGLGEIFKQ